MKLGFATTFLIIKKVSVT